MAPMTWAAQKVITSSGLMPAKVFENARPIVPAGLAKDVEEVNQ